MRSYPQEDWFLISENTNGGTVGLSWVRLAVFNAVSADNERNFMLSALITLIAVALDQFTKVLVSRNMALGDTIPIIKDVLHITYVENRGAAFSMLSESRWVFLTFSTLAIAAIIYVMIKFRRELSKLSSLSLAMVLGGAIGNMIDRTFRGGVLFDGAVVDFIDFRLINFAVFNVADSFVCVGAVLLVLSVILDEKKAREKKTATAKAEENVNDGNA